MAKNGITIHTVYPEVPPRVVYFLNNLDDFMLSSIHAVEIRDKNDQQIVRRTE